MTTTDIIKVKIPCGFGDVSEFHQLMLIHVLREEKSLIAMVNFVKKNLGEKFVESIRVTMSDIYKTIDSTTPCVFVLSAGADPTDMLLRFAKEEGFGNRLQVISLGQGQGPHAEALINKSKVTGDWVLLQNCHLARSWLLSLEKLVLDLSESEESKKINYLYNFF